MDYVTNNNVIIDSKIIINWKEVMDLIDEDYKFYKLLYEEFLTEIKVELNKIQNNKNINNEEIYLIFHKLKGSSIGLGFNNLSSIFHHYLIEFKDNKSINIDFDLINQSLKDIKNEFYNYYKKNNII
jgi:hypothetical protein